MIKNKFMYILAIAYLAQCNSINALDFAAIYNKSVTYLNKRTAIGSLVLCAATTIGILFYKKISSKNEISTKNTPQKQAESIQSPVADNNKETATSATPPQAVAQKTLVTIEMFSLHDKKQHSFEMHLQ